MYMMLIYCIVCSWAGGAICSVFCKLLQSLSFLIFLLQWLTCHAPPNHPLFLLCLRLHIKTSLTAFHLPSKNPLLTKRNQPYIVRDLWIFNRLVLVYESWINCVFICNSTQIYTCLCPFVRSSEVLIDLLTMTTELWQIGQILHEISFYHYD